MASIPASHFVMPGRSRPKDGVLSHAYARPSMTSQKTVDARHKAGHDELRVGRDIGASQA
jgi:hypothetical protein